MFPPDEKNSREDLPATTRPATASEGLLSDDEAIRILTAPMPPDAFTVLSRRRRQPLSDEEAARILAETGRSDLPASPLPVAARAPRPPARLEYRIKPRRVEELRGNVSDMPLGYRVFRLVIWLVVAALMGSAILMTALR